MDSPSDLSTLVDRSIASHKQDGSPGGQLDDYFPMSHDATFPSQPPRKFNDDDIRHIACCLEQDGSPWANVPRLYTVLRIIDRLDEIETFTTQEINDFWLPLTTKTFPRGLGITSRSSFLATQAAVLSGSLDLEKGERGLHRHYAADANVPLISQGDLGEGAYGKVDIVKSTSTGSVYARKRISRFRPGQVGSNRNRQIMQDFEKEMKAFKHLDHRHIVKLVGSYTDPNFMALLMSPVADVDLRSFLDKFTLRQESKSLLSSFFGCLAGGLEYMHRMNVRHKDIKPANILIKGDCVFYTDLGLAFLWETDGHSTTENSFPIATRKYSPPESFNGENRNTTADIWSLGCVFLEMATLLCGFTLVDLLSYLGSCGTRSSIYAMNHDVAIRWLDILRPPASEKDIVPLTMVKEMMSKSSLRRLSAHAVFEQLCAEENLLMISDCCRKLPDTSTTYTLPTPTSIKSSSLQVSTQIRQQSSPSRPEYTTLPPSSTNSTIPHDGSGPSPTVPPSTARVTPTVVVTPDPSLAMPGPQQLIARSLSRSPSRLNRPDRPSLARNTQLRSAALQNDVSKARAVLDDGADVNHQDFKGETVLWISIEQSNTDMISLFLEKGANMHLSNKNGINAFHHAAAVANLETINMLIDRGANMKQQGHHGWSSVYYVLLRGRSERRQLIELLVSKGTDPQELNDIGETVLHVAASNDVHDIIEVLISYGINIDTVGVRKATPLVYAATSGHTATVAKLLSLGAQVDFRNDEGRTPLAMAAMGGHVGVMEKLLEAGADIQSRDNHGCSALVLAAYFGQLGSLQLLVGTGRVDLNRDVDQDGWSALHGAAYRQKNYIVKAVIEYGAEVELRTLDGRTPLHIAVDSNFSDTVSILLEFGADPLAVREDGANAIDIAVKKGLVDILQLLEDALEE